MAQDHLPISLDLFDKDTAAIRRLDEIVDSFRANARPRLFEFTPNADEFQSKFIKSAEPCIRLLAPAGSGKTQSIANRVVYSVSKGGKVSGQLLLTFDNSASISLAAKLTDLLAKNSIDAKPNVFTLNKFGYAILRGHLRNIYGQLAIGTDVKSDCREAIQRSLKELRQVAPELAALLPRKLSSGVYLEFISLLKNNLIIPDDLVNKPETRLEFLNFCNRTNAWKPWMAPSGENTGDDAFAKKVTVCLMNVYRLYWDIMREHKKIDFDDQKLLPYLALRSNTPLVEAFMASYGSIIVDEFQDINRLDFELIRTLANGKCLTVVGDDDQAIYGFRGCSPEYIIDFSKHVERAVDSHVLQINYRCPKNIVEMSTKLIRHNKYRVEKNPVANSDTDADIKVWHCVDSASEAQIIARTARKLVEKEQDRLGYSDIAVLYRMNSQSLPLQFALILEEIPYHCRLEENIILSDAFRNFLDLVKLSLDVEKNPAYTSADASRLLCQAFFRYAERGTIEKLHKTARDTGGYSAAARQLASQDRRLPQSFVEAIGILGRPQRPGQLVRELGMKFEFLGGMVGGLEQAILNYLPLGEMADIAGRFRGDTAQFHAMLSGLMTNAKERLSKNVEAEVWRRPLDDRVASRLVDADQKSMS